MSKQTKSITIRGVEYPSPRAAGDAFGVSRTAIASAKQRGKLDKVGLGNVGRGATPISIRDVEYVSVREAARALGLTAASVRQAKREGRLDTVGTGKRKPRVKAGQDMRETRPAVQVAPKRRIAVPCVVEGTKSRPAKPSPLAPLFCPRWSSKDDYFILKQRKLGVPIDKIALGLARTNTVVQQRWHKLRVIPGVLTALESYGVTDQPYPAEGGK